MSIASPRPSFNLPTSRRTSISTTTSTIHSPSSSRPASIRGNSSTATVTTSTITNNNAPAQARRRDRAALREFYNLQSSQPTSQPATQQTAATRKKDDQTAQDPLSTLDLPSFSASSYVSSLLTTSTPDQLLHTLNSITISSLGLEGDKKALVYDNYTTLLSATSTISRMRENVDPMAPVTTTLEPAVRHIADTAVRIADQRKATRGDESGKRELVKRVLGAAERLKGLREEGRQEDARREWGEVKQLLGKWEGVKGVEEVRRECVEVMGED